MKTNFVFTKIYIAIIETKFVISIVIETHSLVMKIYFVIMKSLCPGSAVVAHWLLTYAARVRSP
jgi:hypothetical protein